MTISNDTQKYNDKPDKQQRHYNKTIFNAETLVHTQQMNICLLEIGLANTSDAVADERILRCGIERMCGSTG